VKISLMADYPTLTWGVVGNERAAIGAMKYGYNLVLLILRS
jgi:hypothetical protein